jgi:hypothetical protein
VVCTRHQPIRTLRAGFATHPSAFLWSPLIFGGRILISGPYEASKAAKILELVKRPGGATAKELMKATGWQPYSVRVFLSGTNRCKMSLDATSTQEKDDERVYSLPRYPYLTSILLPARLQPRRAFLLSGPNPAR